MRTRIALMSAVPAVVVIISTVSSIAPAASPSIPSAKTVRTTRTVALPPDQLTAFDRRPAVATAASPLALPAPLRSARPAPPPAPVPAPPPAPVPAPAPTPVVAAAAPAPAPPPPGPVDTVTPFERAAWERVAMCEEGGNWSAEGGRFSGGLGITRSNWAAYGGLEFAPDGAMASEDQQIMVAQRIQASPPDQRGCAGW